MQYVVKTKNLNFSYKKGYRDISDMNLQVPQNSIYGFLGPNGSGKTTTIRLLLGLLKQNTGEVFFNDEPFAGNRIKCLDNIGALIENPSLYEHLTAKENLIIAAKYRKNVPKERINEVLEIVKLGHVGNKKIKAFSLGMKQRLGIAIALLSKPDLLILDEPTNGLDPKGIIEIRDLINDLSKKQNTTIFISSHLLSEIEKLCTHVGIIKEGKLLFQDTVSALKNSHKSIILQIETDMIANLVQLANGLNLNPTIVSDKEINLTILNKKDIPNLINNIIKEGISIFQFKIKDSLEELFLSITEK